MSTIVSPAGRLAELFASEGAGEYLGEPVTVAQHLLQAGALAAAGGAPPALVAAALLLSPASTHTGPCWRASCWPGDASTLLASQWRPATRLGCSGKGHGGCGRAG